jgi:putative thiazole-containing bacteriocin maturation protein
MSKMSGSSRLKTNKDTTFIPDSGGGIYFRNNKHSFRISGSSVYEWMEKLIPMFDGTRSMQEITDGLPETYQKRVYEFADILLQNEFVRDINHDDPHTLSEDILRTYDSQISYLDYLLGSGASRFEKYRQSSLLVIGSGSFLSSLLTSLLDSGIQSIHLFITDQKSTSKKCIQSFLTATKKQDSYVEIIDITSNEIRSWKEIIQPFDAVLFVGQEDQLETVQRLSYLCEQENKNFFPAITWKQVGIVGPSKDWDSAWKRLGFIQHKMESIINHTATALLANVLAFQYFNSIQPELQSEKSQVFLLDMETLEGKWHSYLPHPLAYDSKPFIRPLDTSKWFSSPKQQKIDLLAFFHRITSPKIGIFRSFGPKNLLQLPLSQCQVRINDPHSEEMISSILCTGDSHNEAQREAGLSGIETYASRLLSPQKLTVSFGVGETIPEAIFRGIRNYSYHKLDFNQFEPKQAFLLISEQIEDKQAQYYAKCLETYGLQSIISFDQRVFGFDTLWININNDWYSGLGLDLSTALRSALKKALQAIQNQNDISFKQMNCNLPVCSTPFPKAIDAPMDSMLEVSIQTLNQHNLHLQVFDVMLEPYIRQHVFTVGVMIGEEKS